MIDGIGFPSPLPHDSDKDKRKRTNVHMDTTLFISTAPHLPIPLISIETNKLIPNTSSFACLVLIPVVYIVEWRRFICDLQKKAEGYI